jgi:hypothetical protein
MNTIVAVYWEGRTYNDDSWLGDWEVLKDAFEDDPVFVGGYDTAFLFSKRPVHPKEPFQSTIISTRHGETSTEICPVGEAFEDADEIGGWQRWPSLKEWREDAVRNEIVPF